VFPPAPTDIFSLISLFFATIAGTQAIENSRASNVSREIFFHFIKQCCIRNFSFNPFSFCYCLFVFISHSLFPPHLASHLHSTLMLLCRVARTGSVTAVDRIAPRAPKRSRVPIFDRSIAWGMPIVPRGVDEPGKGVAFLLFHNRKQIKNEKKKNERRLRRRDLRSNMSFVHIDPNKLF